MFPKYLFPCKATRSDLSCQLRAAVFADVSSGCDSCEVLSRRSALTFVSFVTHSASSFAARAAAAAAAEAAALAAASSSSTEHNDAKGDAKDQAMKALDDKSLNPFASSSRVANSPKQATRSVGGKAAATATSAAADSSAQAPARDWRMDLSGFGSDSSATSADAKISSSNSTNSAAPAAPAASSADSKVASSNESSAMPGSSAPFAASVAAPKAGEMPKGKVLLSTVPEHEVRMC